MISVFSLKLANIFRKIHEGFPAILILDHYFGRPQTSVALTINSKKKMAVTLEVGVWETPEVSLSGALRVVGEMSSKSLSSPKTSI